MDWFVPAIEFCEYICLYLKLVFVPYFNDLTYDNIDGLGLEQAVHMLGIHLQLVLGIGVQTGQGQLTAEYLTPARSELDIVLTRRSLYAHGIALLWLELAHSVVADAAIATLVAVDAILDLVGLVAFDGVPSEFEARLVHMINGEITWLARVLDTLTGQIGVVGAVVAVQADAANTCLIHGPAVAGTLATLRTVGGLAFVATLGTF